MTQRFLGAVLGVGCFHKTEWPTIGCNERLTLPAALSQQLAAGMCAGAPLLENRMSL